MADTSANTTEDVQETTETETTSEDQTQEFRRRRAMTRSVIAAFTAASALSTTLPLPIKDAIMLSPIELAEINALASIYDIPQEESVHKILDSMAQLGIISMAARGAIGVLDRSAKIRMTAKFKSAGAAALIVAGVGIASAYAFEQVYLGKRSINDLGVARKVRESKSWQAISQAVSNNLQKVMNEDTIDGLKVFASELAKTLTPTE